MYVKRTCPKCGNVTVLDVWACSEVTDHSRTLDHIEFKEVMKEEEFLKAI